MDTEFTSSQQASAIPRHVLFLDDDLAFLGMIKEIFGSLSRGSWTIHLAAETGLALSLLEKQSMDLVVVDLVMPVMDGGQFLGLVQQKYPDLPKVILTGRSTAEARTVGLDLGVNLFLEKPTQPSQFQTIFVALNELAGLHSQKGFRGVLRQVGLSDVIQMECLARNSSVLELQSKETTGRIYIKDGAIIHAECAKDSGETALTRILGLPGGKFTLKPFAKPAQVTIQGQWEFLLMEAARQLDEASSPQPPSLPDETLAPVPDRRGSRKESATTHRTKSKSKDTPLSNSAANAIPSTHPIASAARPRSAKGVPHKSTASRRRPAGQKRVQEVLLWAAADDHLLFASPTPESDLAAERLRRIQWMEAEGDYLRNLLGLGPLEGLDLEESQDRILTRFRPEGRVWVQVSYVDNATWERTP